MENKADKAEWCQPNLPVAEAKLFSPKCDVKVMEEAEMFNWTKVA